VFQSTRRYLFTILFLFFIGGLAWLLPNRSSDLAWAKDDKRSVALGKNNENKSQFNSIAKLLQQADSLREQGSFLRAQELLTSGLKSYPNDFQIRLTLAQLLRSMGHIARAENLYRELHAEQPNREEPLIALSHIALERLELSNALKYAREAVLVSPYNQAAHLCLAAALIANDDLNEADLELKRKPGDFTLDAERLYLTYQLNLKENQPAEALVALRQAIQLKSSNNSSNSSNSSWLMDLTYLYRQMGDYDNALRVLHFYLYTNPLSLDAWSKVAALYEYNFHEYDQAIRAYREILKLDPEIVDALVGIDRCKQKSNDLAAALKDQLWKFLRQSKTFGNSPQEQDTSVKTFPFLRRTKQ
jgi:tetratricopeptide (TPR) repeat protein